MSTAAGAATSGVLPGPLPAPAAGSAGRRHRAVVFGAGGMAAMWLTWFLPELAERCEVVALVDVDREVLREHGQARGLWPGRCFTDSGAALAAVRAGALAADCAFVVVPPRFHREIIVGAVAAGLHVLTEKPLADTWSDCRAVAEVAHGPAKISVVQNYRYSPAVLAARRLLAQRVVGDPYLVAARFRADYRAYGSWSGPARHEMASPVLADAAVHHLDQIRHLTGLDFVEVVCDEWRPATADGFAGGCCVNLLAVLEGQVRATYEANVICAGEQRSWMGEEYRIECHDGALVVRGEGLSIERFTPQGLTTEPVPLEPMPQRYHMRAIAEFLDWLDGADYAGPRVSDNLHSMRAMFAAIQSAQRRAWVRVDEVEWEGPDEGVGSQRDRSP